MRRFGLLGLAWLAIAAAPVPQGKLPDLVTPTAYRLDLTVDPAQPRYSGHTEIEAVLAKATSTIFLHGSGLTVTGASVTSGTTRVLAKYTEVDPSGVARLDLAKPLPAGRITFRFDYTAGFRDGAEGLFRSKVGDDWYAWTQMEPIDARRMFPGFDEPGFKTPFAVTVTAPRTAKVFGNAPELSAKAAGAMTVHRFAPTKPLPTYLVALGVGPFDVVDASVPANAVRKSPLAFRVIATKGQRPRMDYAATEAPKLLGLLEDYFGIAYPYEKLDFLASPIQGGAMENAGLIIFEDSLILLDKDAPFSQLRGFGEVAAHEMAHQWFGDLVTPTWWTDIWLNESFAEWMGKNTADRWRPDLGIAASELDDAFGAMDTDALGKGRPIRQPIVASAEVGSAFDAITYQKGAQVVSMFENYVGAEVFRSGVRRHLTRFAYRNASADDFFASVGAAANDPKVVPAMRTFTDQTGVPVVRVGDGERSVSLTQSRYRPLGVAPAPAQRWTIPMCLARGEGRACTLLDQPAAAIPAVIGTAPALVPNANGGGYYRFSLDAAGWDRLIAAAPTLPGRDAMAAADSLWADFTAGNIGFDRVAKATAAFAQNPERLAAVLLGYRLRELSLTAFDPAERAGYQRLMASVYGPLLAKLGFDPRAAAHGGEPVPRQALRQSLLPLVAFEARDPAIRARLASAAQAYVGGDANAVDPAFRGAALRAGVQDLGAPFMTSLRDALVKSRDPLFRAQAARALGGANTPALAEAALALARSPGVQPPELFSIAVGLTSQPETRDPTTAWFDANFDAVMAAVPAFARSQAVNIYRGYCTAADAVRVDAFMTKHAATFAGTGALEAGQTKERIGLCVALKTARGAQIAKVLASY